MGNGVWTVRSYVSVLCLIPRAVTLRTGHACASMVGLGIHVPMTLMNAIVERTLVTLRWRHVQIQSDLLYVTVRMVIGVTLIKFAKVCTLLSSDCIP